MGITRRVEWPVGDDMERTQSHPGRTRPPAQQHSRAGGTESARFEVVRISRAGAGAFAERRSGPGETLRTRRRNWQ